MWMFLKQFFSVIIWHVFFCLIPGHEYCLFNQNESVSLFTGHRGQMSQFCGHAEVCKQFNNPESLQMAKENVEKYYPVVGVMEYMNKTLKVLEDKLPDFKAYLKILRYQMFHVERLPK